MDWSQEVIEKAIGEIERIHLFTETLSKTKEGDGPVKQNHVEEVESFFKRMEDELGDDFNVPGVLSIFFSMIRMINREYFGALKEGEETVLSSELKQNIIKVVDFVKESTGLVHENASEVLQKIKMAKKVLSGVESISEQEIETLIEERKNARVDKDWAKSDLIRDKLKDKGIVLRDNPDGTVSWTFK